MSLDVSDRFAIQDVLAVYCRGIDRLDERLIAQAYWPDADEDHGIFKGKATDFAPWIVRFLAETYHVTSHRLGQSYVRPIAGDAACAETYFSSLHRLRLGDGSTHEAVDGRYLDDFEKRGGVWRISRRLVVLDFMRQFQAAGAETANLPGLTFGKRTLEDPSYSRLS
jgi:SnoaL-like domain